MTISLYDASVPVFQQMMRTLSIILDKAAKSENIAQELLSARLFPDMYDLTRQVQMSSDFDQSGFGAFGRYGDSLLPGQRNTFDELQRRIDKTIQFLSSIPRERIDGSEEREIVVRAGTPREKT